MESPIRKMQKRNDYQRHKLFRKIKRKRDAQLEQQKNIAEKELRRKLRRPKYDEGKDETQEVQMEDGTVMRIHPSALRSNELTVTTPDVVVKGKGPYRSAFNGDDVLEFANILTAGGLNNLSPTQWYGRIRNLHQLSDGNVGEYLNQWINGNSGIVPEKYQREYPTASLIANMIADGTIYAMPRALRSSLLKSASKLPIRSNAKFQPNDKLLGEIQNDPNLYHLINNVDDAESMDAVRKFYREDVFPRYKNIMNNSGQEFNVNSDDFINGIKMKKADISPVGTDGFYDPANNEIFVDNNIVGDPREFVNVGSHELRHALDHSYSPNTELENYYINKAYNPRNLQSYENGIKEGKAINTGVRGQISYDYNKYGEDLNNVIRNMHDEELKSYYPSYDYPGADQFIPFVKPGMKDIRNALMYVPSVAPFVIGTQYNEYNAGKNSGIHINPKNIGKFNALKKRTGKTTEELTHSKNPLTRKRAIFAQNARKWKHK